MNIKKRRILYSFFLAIFFTIAPILILYTSGYRYDFEYNRIIETGSLVVRTDPEQATITMDGNLMNQKSPAIINTILPGEINLLVEKDGYIPWEKEITIYPKVSAFQEDIKLYPKKDPIKISEDVVDRYWINGKQNKIAYLTKNSELKIFDLSNNKISNIQNPGKNKITQFEWSETDDRFFYGISKNKSTEYVIVNSNDTSQALDINEFFNKKIISMQWDPYGSNSLYTLSEEGIYKINYLSKTSRLVKQGVISDFLAEKDRIIIIQKAQDKANKISWIDPSDTEITHIIQTENIFDGAKILKSNSSKISILNPYNQTLVVIDPAIKKISQDKEGETVVNAISAIWSKDGRTIVYTDGFGIYRMAFIIPISVIAEKTTSTLLLRYSEPIKEIAWADNESRILYNLKKSVRIVDAYSKSKPHVTILFEKEVKNLKTATMAKLISFIDEEGFLSAYPLSLEKNRRPFFLGNE